MERIGTASGAALSQKEAEERAKKALVNARKITPEQAEAAIKELLEMMGNSGESDESKVKKDAVPKGGRITFRKVNN